jgi:putative IMPACT (imprinted ancient) family translation regulator
LVQAYKTAALNALEASTIVEKTIDEEFILNFDYAEMNVVMRIIKDENLNISHQKMEMNCEFEISVRKKDAKRIFEIFKNTYKVSIKRKKMLD